jgi:class 3 adenylate cyclase
VVKPVVVESVLDLKSGVSALWKVLADTEYLNRVQGLAPFTLSPIDGPDGERYRVTTRAGGFRVEWDERPFEWVHERSFSVLRRFRKGPISSIDTRFQFEPVAAGGTRVTLKLELAPQKSWLAPIVRFGARRQLDALARAVRDVDTAIASELPPPAPARQVREDALARALSTLRAQAPAEIVARLEKLVRDERDDVVSRIRPFEWADRWGVDRRDVLAACLNGVRAGLFELRWEVVCPSCRTAAERLPTLSALVDHGECHLCDLSFGLAVDEAVEVTFLPAAAVRAVDSGQYCVGGPARTPHVVAQALVPARGTVELIAPAEPGRYRLFVRGGRIVPVEVLGEAPAAVSVDDGDTKLAVMPGGTLTVRSAHDDVRHVKLERAQFPSSAATAREVTALPGFRRDFSADVLRADMSLRVSRMALFFSDLTGSTQLYSNVGDAPALKLVQDHFDVVLKQIEAHQGTLVKTIGDAVMAAFVDELDGLRASLAILDAFETFRRGHPHREQTHIKLGLYAGPSYLVTANGILDYFGQTVNIAARLQAQANAGELVVEAPLAEQGVATGLLQPGAVVERYPAELKGVHGTVDVARIRLSRAS